jgi:hypothetical protein
MSVSAEFWLTGFEATVLEERVGDYCSESVQKILELGMIEGCSDKRWVSSSP